MNRTLIKVCGLTCPENINGVLGLGVDFAGLIFVPGSLRFVGASLRSNALPKGNFVGVFANESIHTVLEHVKQFGLVGVQLHGQEDRAYCLQLGSELAGRTLFKAVAVTDAASCRLACRYDGAVTYLLFDGSQGGSGEKFEPAFLDHYEGNSNFFLAGGIGPEEVTRCQELRKYDPRFVGVDLNSRFEVTPGHKDLAKLKQFIEEVRA